MKPSWINPEVKTLLSQFLKNNQDELTLNNTNFNSQCLWLEAYANLKCETIHCKKNFIEDYLMKTGNGFEFVKLLFSINPITLLNLNSSSLKNLKQNLESRSLAHFDNSKQEKIVGKGNIILASILQKKTSKIR